jgi:hypothetical protein
MTRPSYPSRPGQAADGLRFYAEGSIKLAFKETLQEFHRLSELEKQEEEGLSTLIPNGITFPPRTEAQEARQQKYLGASRPRQADLLRFLEGLPVSELMVVEALMYSGRDNTQIDLKPETSREFAIRTIMEKVQRSKYVADGASRVSDVSALVARWKRENP